MSKQELIIKDEIDLISIFSVILDNFNLLLSIFISSLFVIFVYYLSASSVYLSEAMLEIKQDSTSFLPKSLLTQGISKQNDLDAESEIYKSNSTIQDVLETIIKSNNFDIEDIPSSADNVRKNLSVNSDQKSLLTVSYKSTNQELASYMLNLLNYEYIDDRKDFAKESTLPEEIL